ncbi:R3H domain-containing protein 2-like [Phoenix dactylifera]|uniref:R3H domain-containing protein 2-like n=1 Tax=Phoenix dactylifera TaxID=42345 RepID=A0A8B9AZF3_PHODC|nr:R3H domain-containing protein 2-like [Phoenix dactylifera]XP_038989253.1 R3H domain-containing protein 2-like [Phoenix dactylifera]
MEGSAEDPGEWELADVDDSMFRLMLSSKKSSDSSTPPPSTAGDFAEEAPPLPDSVASSSSSGLAERRRGPSEEVLSQVDQFLREALEKPRERLSILRMEQDIEKFICDHTQRELEFKDLPTSYLRLAAHRLAQHFYLQSIAMSDTIMPDGSGSRIVLHKTSDCRFPPVRLADIPVNLPQEDANNAINFAIKRRPQKESVITSGNTCSSKTNLTKSVEQRKEEYNKARARIFNSNGGGVGMVKTEGEPNLQDSFQHRFLESARSDGKSTVEQSETNPGRALSDSSIGSNRSNRNRADKEPAVGKYRTSNRVAIFRDREVDRKDPDYDRSYDRYTQRFDPGFGFSGGPYLMQPMFSPAVNYNTEFPQLGSSHRPQIPIEHQPRHIPQHLRGPWSATSGPSAISYGHPDGMMASFNANQVGAPSTSSVYMHSSQYSDPPCPRMSFVHYHEHVQPFAQTPQQQAEANSGLARSR